MTWTSPAISRIPDSQIVGALCESRTCFTRSHRAIYLFETANRDTGEVRRRALCITAAARLAYTLKIDFPPGGKPAAAQSNPKGG